MSQILILLFFPLNCTHRSILPAPALKKLPFNACGPHALKDVESNKTKTFRPLLLCMINTPHGLSEYTNIWVHPIKTFLWQHILRIPFFYIRPKNRLHFYTPCQVLVINLDKTSSMAKFSWSFVRWAMLQTVNWVILPSGMMQNTLQLIMPQVCHITCSAILPALTLTIFCPLAIR